jgi:hypothetical protein
MHALSHLDSVGRETESNKFTLLEAHNQKQWQHLIIPTKSTLNNWFPEWFHANSANIQ